MPARIAPSPDYGWGYIEVKGANPEQVTVASGGANSVTFTTAYASVDNVGTGARICSYQGRLIDGQRQRRHRDGNRGGVRL